jgi:hypothetical protein
MRIFLPLRLTVIFALLTACSSSEEPIFGTAKDVTIPTTGKVTGPRFSQGAEGGLVLSWMESIESGTALHFAVLTDGSFSPPGRVLVEPRMFVNWADLPSVMQVSEDHWVAHWLRYSADKTYAYDVVVSQSVNAGTTWSEAVTAHTDGTPTEHGFVSMYPEVDGVALLWLDGRNTGHEPGENVLDTSMTLRSALLTSDGRITREQLIDDSVCDCCQTDVAVSSKGPIAVYRDRTAEEVRDIYVTRKTDGQWQEGVPIHEDNWVIAGCPVNGPSIVATGDDVAISWFSVVDGSPVIKVVTSDDGGLSFTDPVEVASGRIAGYVRLTALDDASVVVSWVSKNDTGSNTLNLRRISNEGHLAPVYEIAEISQLRVVPQLAYQHGSVFVAWTDEHDDTRHLRLVQIPVNAD